MKQLRRVVALVAVMAAVASLGAAASRMGWHLREPLAFGCSEHLPAWWGESTSIEADWGWWPPGVRCSYSGDAGTAAWSPGMSAVPPLATAAVALAVAVALCRAARREAAGYRDMPTISRWTSLFLAVLVVALAVRAPIGLVLSIRRHGGWEVESPLALLGGVLLMGVAMMVGILLASSAWRGEARPAVAITGASLALLVAVAGTLVMTRAVMLFPGPLPAGMP